ncbi:MAG: (d)CMP kinase, partial [Gemmatimonadota bacterium]|nr:(d)CMP kinase [Gemmatimonadota bacterium]
IGTVVFPDAAVKIFLIADPAERAKRRLRERLYRQPNDGEVAAETRRILARDDMDAAQSAMAADATVIDTTSLRQAEQIERIASLAREIIDRRSHSPSEPD